MTGRKGVAVIGLAALLVLDVILVGWALTSNRRNAVAAATATSKATSASPSASASKSASPSPSASKKTAPAESLTMIIEAADANVLWAGDSGGCAGKSSVSVSTDAGATWAKNESPGSITRLKATSATEALAVGGDASCAAALWATSDGGASWGEAQSADSAWGRYPDKPSRVLTPTGGTVTPCDGKKPVVDLAVVSAAGAEVLCNDGKVLSTLDSGATWTEAVSAPGAMGMTTSGQDAGYVATTSPDCDGTLVASFKGSTVSEGTCVEDATAAPGRTDVAASGAAVWLLVDGTVWASTDSGATFAKAGSL